MMRSLVAVLCALTVVTATPLFGTEQCAGGPSVWCVNIRTADQCGAVTHCQQTVWNKPVVNSVPCDLCKEAVAAASSFIKDNATESEIQSILEKVCDFLREPTLTEECKEIVGLYLPIIMNMLKSELDDPSGLCCSLGLCKSLQKHLASLKPKQLLSNEIPDVDLSELAAPFMANVPLLLYPQEKPDQPKDVCKDCVQFFTDLQDTLKSNASFSDALIKNALTKCDMFGPASDMCKNYVNQYAEMVLQGLIQVSADTICCEAGICSKEKTKPQEVIPAKLLVPAKKLLPAVKVSEGTTKSARCELCVMIVEKVEQMLDNNQTKAKIEEVLEKICDLIPSQYQGQCKLFMGEYLELLIHLLESGSGAEYICQCIGVCPRKVPKIVRLGSEDTNFLYCEVCKSAMRYVDEMLEKNSTQEQIKDLLDKLCNYLPDTDYYQCCSIIKQYEPLMISLLLETMEPRFVCQKLGVCPSANKPLLGTEKCMWGPSYWCKDLETAGSCNAIEHCKRHVWN